MTSSSTGWPPPGHDPRWDDAHWDAFARHLGAVPGLPGKPGRAGQARRASPWWTTTAAGSRPACVSTCTSSSRSQAVVDGAADGSPLNAIVAAAEAGGTVTVTGPSGGGKSHAARHAALALAGQGRLPVWVRCSEYAQGRFSVLLARATAPYTVDQPLELIRRAWDAGAAPVLILDGLNECPAGLAGELLEQLAAARLRVPCGVVITSADEVPLPDTGNVSHVELQLPRPAERQALLSSYGAAGCPASNAFQTPLRTCPGRRVRRRARPGRRQPPTCSTRTCGAGRPARSAARCACWRRRWTRRCAAHSRCRRPPCSWSARGPSRPRRPWTPCWAARCSPSARAG